MKRSFINQSSLVVFIILLLSNVIAFGQKEAYRWYFGRKAGFDFSTTPPTKLSNSPYAGVSDVEEAHAAISDKDGNFLFYTNGQTIWDNTGTAMPNGTGINGNFSTTQCATVFPVPGSLTDYYVLTTPVTGSATELLWNRIDMSLNTGKGDIKAPVASNKNQTMPSCPTYMMESVVSVPHFNGTDIWVIAHTADDPGSAGTNEGGSFIVWLVSSAGITYSNTYTIGYAYPQLAGVSRGIGIMKANSCFTRIFISYYNASSRIEGFSFSNSTGAISNWPAPISAPLVIDQYRNSGGTMTAIGSFSYGLEISGSGRYLYNTISGETGNKELTQYDLQAGTGTNANIMNSAVRLTPATADGVRYGQLQIGPDGKIYHTLHNWNNIGAGGYCKIGVIDAPNAAGTGANFIESAYVWPAGATGVGSTMGLTSFHKGFLAGKAAITSNVGNLREICLGDAVNFTAQTSGSTISLYQWNIDKNLNATIDYSGAALSTITHTYGSTGIYDVELTVTDQCGYTYSSISQVEVLPKPVSAGTITCSAPIVGNVTLPNGAYSYAWYSNAAATTVIGTGTTNVPLLVGGTSGNVYLKAVSGTSSSSSTNTLRTTGTMQTWGAAGATTVDFTVTNAITLNSFEWGNGTIPGWPYPATTYTVTVQNSAGTVNYFTNSYTTASGSSSYNKYTETGLNLTLAPGTYRLLFSSVAQLWNAATTATDANVDITANPGRIGNFNYSVTNYTITNLACAQITTIPFNCPLPVTWLSFEANRTSNSSALLEWSTADEKNSNGFQIQRSTDGIHFETIDFVKAAGNSNQILHYSYTDNTAPSGKVYYRLVEEDFNGTKSYSSIREIKGNVSNEVTLFPNPGNGQFIITGLPQETDLSISILSITGQLITTINTSPNKVIEMNEFSKGLYIVKIKFGNDVQTVRYLNQ